MAFTWPYLNVNPKQSPLLMPKLIMKNNLLLIVFLCSLLGFAQPPAGYYNSATGSGYTLKTQLFNIINNHNDRGYSGLYTTYLTSDKDFYYENDGTLLDNYSENPTGPDPYNFTYGTNQDDGTGGNNEGERYNREHLVPQSVFNSATPMFSDAFFVVPSDKKVNAQRGDLPFGKVGSANWTSLNGTKRGNNLNSGYSAGYSDIVFEPIDEFKGDIARNLLYFATRYEDVVAGFNYVMFNNTSNQVFAQPFLNILLTWNQQDPVSNREIARNNAIYARQGNRNPFIDNWNYVSAIWGQPLASAQFDLNNQILVYPNPSNTHSITIESSKHIMAIDLITINGQLIQHQEKPIIINSIINFANIPSGFYFLKIKLDSIEITKKISIN
jgi:endonuclease I